MRRLNLSPEQRHEHRLQQKRTSYRTNAAGANKRKRARRAEMPEGAKRQSLEQARRWKAENPERNKEHRLKSNFGITLDEYNRLLEAQGGHCAICPATSARPGDKYLAVDHDHKNNQVRGLLCSRHNLGIGYFQDNAEYLTRAAAYLRAVA